MNRTAFLLACLLASGGLLNAQNPLNDLFKGAPNKGGQPGGVTKGISIFTNATSLLKSAAGIPLAEELNIGGSVAVEVVARFGGIWRDTDATRRINLLGKSLARYGNRPELPYRFGLLNSDQINAFSAPGGYIFVTKGLYELATTEDQLAGVLAHEIAHVTERHALNMIRRNNMVASGMRIGAASTKELREFGQGIESITQALFEKGFDPNTEYASDQEARRIVRLTGYDPLGLNQVLFAMMKREGTGPRIFSTHPPHQSRIDRLK